MKRFLTLLTLTTGLAFLSEARAAVVYFEPSGGIIVPNDFNGVSVDFETGATSNALGGLTGGDANFFFGGSRVSNDADENGSVASWQPVRTGTGNEDAILNLSFGQTIDAGTSSYSTGYGASGLTNPHIGVGAGQFSDGGSGYIGFSLVIDDPYGPGDATVYGWARVTFQDGTGTGILHEWAYEDTGAAINVGVVPEPSGAILAMIGATLGLLRRRR